MYTHTMLVLGTLVFESEFYKCPYCHQEIQKHIHCEGARWHVYSYDNNGMHCSAVDCENNHGKGKCVK